MRGYVVVSGVPRSGTSLAMNIQRVVHGDDRILGKQFPREAREAMRLESLAQEENESDSMYRVRMYYAEKQERMRALHEQPDKERWRDMNPDGFWEMAFTCKGIRYSPGLSELFKTVKDDWRVVKAVSGGLYSSNPDYIAKILYMVRHPRAVAKSQERLFRNLELVDEKGIKRNLYEDLVVHSPDMYIDSSVHAAAFFVRNPDVPVEMFQFEDLVSDPEPVLQKMGEFVGEGDYMKGLELIKPSLNRSRHEPREGEIWKDAEFIHEMLCAFAEDHDIKHMEAILERVKDPKSATRRTTKSWSCFRARAVVNDQICRDCRGNPKTRANMMDAALRVKDPMAESWEDEPCVFECGFDVERSEDEFLTLEESVKRNFWRNEVLLCQ